GNIRRKCQTDISFPWTLCAGLVMVWNRRCWDRAVLGELEAALARTYHPQRTCVSDREQQHRASPHPNNIRISGDRSALSAGQRQPDQLGETPPSCPSSCRILKGE